jgi:hypothetical protein
MVLMEGGRRLLEGYGCSGSGLLLSLCTSALGYRVAAIHQGNARGPRAVQCAFDANHIVCA